MTTLTIEEPTLAAATTDRARQYVVLRSQEPESLTYYVVGKFDASNSDEAIRSAAEKEAVDEEIDTAGTLIYVAVPSRSFQPVSLTAKVEPKIEFKR